MASCESYCVPIQCREIGFSEMGLFHFDKGNTLLNQYLSPSVTVAFHTVQLLSALKSAAGGSSQMSVTVTDQELLHCIYIK